MNKVLVNSNFDKRGVVWRNSYDINLVNINYIPFDYIPFNTSNREVKDAGLLGPITITCL